MKMIWSFQVLSKLESGERLSRPSSCSREFYELMMNCWSFNADMRPRFSLLKGIIADVGYSL